MPVQFAVPPIPHASAFVDQVNTGPHGIGPALPVLVFVVDRDGKLGKRSRTRRFGGRLYRRVLEGMRGCSAHAKKIARRKNKSRT